VFAFKPGDELPCGKKFVRSKSSGLIVGVWCGRRTCRRCYRRLYEGSRRAIAHGADHPPDGFATALLTLTQDPHRRVGIADFQKRWASTRKRLRQLDWMTGFACVVEPHKTGVLHAHATCWVPLWLADELDRDAKQELLRNTWRGNELIPQVMELGWGQVAHMVRVRDGADAVGDYLAKSLQGYLTKSMAAGPGRRLRPVNLSRAPEWYPGGLKAAQRDAQLERIGHLTDPGPWDTVVATVVCARTPW
jgi:hypothetical protein